MDFTTSLLEYKGQPGQIRKLDAAESAQKGGKVFRWEKNERMGGFVPCWDNPKTAQERAAQQIASVQGSSGELPSAAAQGFAQAVNANPDAEFGFGDLLDMVNPLQHIPLVNTLYRNVTGDDIKPIGRIVGGALYGGAGGAAGGLVNVITQSETGKDITGNVVDFALKGEKPHLQSQKHQPEAQLQAALNRSTDEREANTLLAFAPSPAQVLHMPLSQQPLAKHKGFVSFKLND